MRLTIFGLLVYLLTSTCYGGSFDSHLVDSDTGEIVVTTAGGQQVIVRYNPTSVVSQLEVEHSPEFVLTEIDKYQNLGNGWFSLLRLIGFQGRNDGYLYDLRIYNPKGILVLQIPLFECSTDWVVPLVGKELIVVPYITYEVGEVTRFDLYGQDGILVRSIVREGTPAFPSVYLSYDCMGLLHEGSSFFYADNTVVTLIDLVTGEHKHITLSYSQIPDEGFIFVSPDSWNEYEDKLTVRYQIEDMDSEFQTIEEIEVDSIF